ncbi:pyridine nucleotide-disulfide oxidoreductase [Eubacterium brachy ATCC 33089]|nr:pyridine nucleotide-disulfide oxidoreductase [Eubacterium brachy ATCC 33089]
MKELEVHMTKLIIIGDGPAGASAALYALRGNIDTTVISKGYGAFEKAHAIENYYGLATPLPGKELHDLGVSQVRKLGADIVSKEVVGISFDGKFKVLTADEEFSADALIIATGTSRKVPRIKGIADFEGLGVSYCAVCDGFFHRGKDVAVLGSGKYALHEAQALLPIAGSVTVLTDGTSPEVEFPSEIKVDERKISHLDGSPMALSTVVFDDSSSMTISGLFIAQGSASSTDLARKVGIATDSNKIVVDENMATNIPGIFACGDCTGGLLQVSKAVYDGATAGNSVVKYLRELTKK